MGFFEDYSGLSSEEIYKEISEKIGHKEECISFYFISL
jgi:hypothetical protein